MLVEQGGGCRILQEVTEQGWTGSHRRDGVRGWEGAGAKPEGCIWDRAEGTGRAFWPGEGGHRVTPSPWD